MSAPTKNSDKKILSQKTPTLEMTSDEASQQEKELAEPPPENDQSAVHRPSPPYTEQLRVSQSKRAA